MDRNIKRTGLSNLVVLFAITVACALLAQLSHAWSGMPLVFLMGVGVLVSAVSWFQMRLEEAERLEKLEMDELQRSRADSALFSQDAEVFPAARAREQFERWFVPGFALVLLAIQAMGTWWLWTRLKDAGPGVIQKGTVAMSLYGMFALVLFLMGKYSAGLARLEGQRLLRPGAGYLMLGAYLGFVVTAMIAAHELKFPRPDVVAAKVMTVVLGLTALETLVNLILEIYRPRVKGRPVRLLYESRLIGLLGQPGGLITTAAQALDYQFGFKVSETWFYRFLERAFAWIVLVQIGVLFLSTAFVIVEPHEQALLERFGRPVATRAVLEPGLHFKWPWPMDKVYRYQTRAVQSFVVGAAPEPGAHEEKVVVWTRAHAGRAGEEFNLLVASREGAAQRREGEGSEQSVPVSLLTVSIPVQYQITNLVDWAYTHRNGGELLERLAAREVVRYLVNVDVDELMGRGRLAASKALQQRIQAQASAQRLGAQILLVGLQDIHPPIGSAQVKVAEAYEAVIGAMQEQQTNVFAARAYYAERVPLAQAEATNLLTRAESDGVALTSKAAAESAQFHNQILAYRAAPAVFPTRVYLDTLVRATANARKYVLAVTNTHDIIQLNLEEKIRADLLDAVLPGDEKR